MTAAPAPSAVAAEGPPDPELVRIRDLIYQIAGIFHPDNKLRLLQERCSRRMRQLQVTTLREYFECLTTKPMRQAELILLLNEITVGETCFFRNQPQLEALRQIVLPRIIEAKSALPVRRLRIWSAGCSTGEEPYTLSILMQEEAQRLKDWKVEILATDLNQRSLEDARTALYGSHSTRNLTASFRQKYFTSGGEDRLQLLPWVRDTVTFSRLNLSDDARMIFMKGIDIIFCCNVLIYFDIQSKRRVIQHFYNNLLPHGYLFLGHSESLYGVNNDFCLVHLPRTTAYVKGERSLGGKADL